MLARIFNFQRNFNLASERLIFRIMQIFCVEMLSNELFITVYLMYMYSNIFIGHLTNLSKDFFLIVFNDLFFVKNKF